MGVIVNKFWRVGRGGNGALQAAIEDQAENLPLELNFFPVWAILLPNCALARSVEGNPCFGGAYELSSSKCVAGVVLVLGCASFAGADSLNVGFNRKASNFPLDAPSTLTLTLNGDGSITGNVVSAFPMSTSVFNNQGDGLTKLEATTISGPPPFYSETAFMK